MIHVISFIRVETPSCLQKNHFIYQEEQAMTTTQLESLTIKDIVTQDFQTAAIFEKHSLDFCCRGGKTVEEACRERGIAPEIIFAELMHVTPATSGGLSRFGQWDADFLIDYIVANHHKYVSKMIPVILAHTQKVASVHGERHPEVIRIASLFQGVAADLTQHMQKEELMLFPYIKHLLNAKRTGSVHQQPPFGSAQNPIRMMMQEHQKAGDELYEIRSLSNSYAPPEDACTTYRVSYGELQEFERDLHQHVHLENNILFPEAVRLEAQLNGQSQS
ncbi:MAG TPA: iron-sulfur cluster repair di-iron protein [Bacteroidetes bacterium]|nr:iron-sulfur cluster repair di-iron protein [Bacteroidota bacterium]